MIDLLTQCIVAGGEDCVTFSANGAALSTALTTCTPPKKAICEMNLVSNVIKLSLMLLTASYCIKYDFQ